MLNTFATIGLFPVSSHDGEDGSLPAIRRLLLVLRQPSFLPGSRRLLICRRLAIR
ncbi:MAG: hypothetical protein H7A53_00865 [Akkermansiaceae bacterium]|nr:hypothetical protein [Akkermansiaceae bacterium]